MKKIIISLCITVIAIAVAAVLNNNLSASEQPTTVQATVSVDEKTTTEILTTETVSLTKENQKNTPKIETLGDFLNEVKFDGISNFSLYKREKFDEVFSNPDYISGYIMEYLLCKSESLLVSYEPQDYGHHFTLYSGEDKYTVSVLYDGYLMISGDGNKYCFIVGVGSNSHFMTTYLRRFRCVPQVPSYDVSNITEKIYRFNPDTVCFEQAREIIETIPGGFNIADIVGKELCSVRNGKVVSCYTIDNELGDYIWQILYNKGGYCDDLELPERGKNELFFTVEKFGEIYEISLNSNSCIYANYKGIEKCFEESDAYYLLKLQLLKHSLTKKDDDVTETVTTTANYPPPGFNASSVLEHSAILGEFCENADFSAQSSYWMSYEQKGKEAVIYSISVSARNFIDKLITDNYDKKAEIRQGATDEALVFESSLYGIKGMVITHLCNDGYLYITCGEVTRGFNIGIDAYNEFMEDFLSGGCVYTPEHPVTVA